MSSRIREAAANEGTGEMTLALTIGDLPEVRNVLEAMLRSMGVESITASDGEQGLALLKSSLHLDLVISDISTPGLDGIELFKIIQQDGALTDVPWMFMSSSDRKYDALEAGCAYFFGKPVTLGDLKRAVATTLDQSMITTM